MKAEGGGVIQMITGDGVFEATAVDKFLETSPDFSDTKTPCTVVSIIGPQDGGKTNLVDSIFETNFDVVISDNRRRKTSKGIWIAKCTEPDGPNIIIMNVEGSDGTDGKDDTQFEKQSALFALTVSDVILVNMPLHDIGREQGGSFPFLTFFLQQRVKLDPYKTRVVFVIRDYGYEIPPNMLENKVKENLEKTWREHVQPRKNAKFSDYFQESVELLPSKSEAFKQKCTQLRKRFSTNNRAGSRQDKVPASGFSLSGKLLWDNIRQNMNLNLSDQKILSGFTRLQKLGKDSNSKMSEPKCIADLKKISDTVFNTLKIDAALKKERDPIKSSDIVVGSLLKNFDKLCEDKGYLSSYKPLVTEQRAKSEKSAKKYAREKAKEIKMSEPKCIADLKKISDTVFNTLKIDAALKKETDPIKSSDMVVGSLLKNFDKLCEDKGYPSSYRPLITEQRAKSEKSAKKYAREKVKEIKMSEPKCIADLKKISDTVFNTLKIDAALKKEVDPIKSSDMVVGSLLKNFDKLCEDKGYPSSYKPLVTEQRAKSEKSAKKYAREKAKEFKMSEPKCIADLKKISDTVFNTLKIDAALKKETDPIKSSDMVVGSLLKNFDKLCEDKGYPSSYKPLVTEQRAKSEKSAKKYAREKAKEFKMSEPKCIADLKKISDTVFNTLKIDAALKKETDPIKSSDMVVGSLLKNFDKLCEDKGYPSSYKPLVTEQRAKSEKSAKKYAREKAKEFKMSEPKCIADLKKISDTVFNTLKIDAALKKETDPIKSSDMVVGSLLKNFDKLCEDKGYPSSYKPLVTEQRAKSEKSAKKYAREKAKEFKMSEPKCIADLKKISDTVFNTLKIDAALKKETDPIKSSDMVVGSLLKNFDKLCEDKGYPSSYKPLVNEQRAKSEKSAKKYAREKAKEIKAKCRR